MVRILLISLTFFFFCTTSSFAISLKRDSIISISGQIVTTKGLSPIPLAHLIIKGQRSGKICDSLGTFHLQIKQSDTLVISALGYRTQNWPVPFIFNNTIPSFFQIPLEKMAYVLKEVDVFALGSWDEFKADFVKLEIKDDYVINKQIIKELAPYNTKPPNIIPPQYRTTIEKPRISDAIFKPAHFLFTKFNSKEKSKRKVSKMIRNEWKLKKLSKNYNAEIVSANTGLKGDALEDFMAYCGPKLEITEVTSRYDILEQIVHNYKEYRQIKKEKQASNL